MVTQNMLRTHQVKYGLLGEKKETVLDLIKCPLPRQIIPEVRT